MGKTNKPAKKLPAKVASRWKASRSKSSEEEARWEAVEAAAAGPVVAMIDEPVSRKERNKKGKKAAKQSSDASWS